MAKTGGHVLKIIGAAESGPADGKVGGEPVILVGDTTTIKGTKGDTGPAWAPTVGLASAAAAAEATSATGSIEIEPGVFILTYDVAV